jgi:hypothetical protein
MKPFALVTAALGTLALSGCAADFASSPSLIPAAGLALHGSVHGGQQPVSGAAIYLLAAGKTGYGSISVSLLNRATSGVLSDTYSRGYVLSDANGAFNITGDWICANASDQVYLAAAGGNPGLAAGSNNIAIQMVAALGTCSTLSASTNIIVNEVTTVAAATALQQFYVDAFHIGTSSTNPSGLTTAFATAANLADYTTGVARTATIAGNGIVPQATINTLANLLSGCINTASVYSGKCYSLLGHAAPPNSSTYLNTTMDAAVSIAKYPSNYVNTLWQDVPASPPFQPSLATQPFDWTLAITYPIAAMVNSMAIDVSGNVWMTAQKSLSTSGSTDRIVKLSPTGVLLSGSTGFTAGGFANSPQGIAIDDTNTVWVPAGSSTVLRFKADGSNYSGFPFFGASNPTGVAIDPFGRAWIANNNHGSGNTLLVIDQYGNTVNAGIALGNVSGPYADAFDSKANLWASSNGGTNAIAQVNSSFVLQSGQAGFTGGGLSAPLGVAVDATDRVWFADSYSSVGRVGLSVFNNDATPVTTDPPYGFGATTTGLATSIAIDGANTVWTAICGSGCLGGTLADQLAHFSATGTLLNSQTNPSYLSSLNLNAGFENPVFSGPQAIAIDQSGNMWVGNSLNTNVIELVGIAAPVKTPLQAAVKAKLLGQRP